MPDFPYRDVSSSTETALGRAQPPDDSLPQPRSLLKLRVEGMRCSNCAKGVENTLLSIPHILRVSVQVVTGAVEVEVSRSSSSLVSAVVAALVNKNYTVDVLGIVPVSAAGTSFVCFLDVVLSHQSSLKTPSIDGVQSILHVRGNVCRVSYDPYVIGARSLLRRLETSLATRQSSRILRVSVRYLIDLIVALVLTVMLHSHLLSEIGQYVGVGVAYAICGRRFIASAVRQVLGRMERLGMEVLVSVGMTGALIGGVVTSNEDERMEFFSMTALLVAVVLMGKFLEDFAKRRATRFLGSLDDEWAEEKSVELLDKTRVQKELLELGDCIRMRAGEKFPCDGKVEWRSGEAVGAIESLITGEDHVVSKSEGDEVLAGSLLVGGSVLVKVTRIGEMTVISQIQQLARQAQNTHLLQATERIVDQVSGLFVPLVLVIALTTFMVWRLGVQTSTKEALYYALAVLMVSCPCALGLAAPTAIVMATSVAAKMLGAIVKNVSVLERLASTRVLVFDKTGTITEGRPTVTAVEQELSGAVWTAIAAVEAASEHPVGKAIGVFADMKSGDKLRDITQFESKASVGVSGIFRDKTIEILGDAESSWLTDQRSQGRVAVGVFVDGDYKGGIALRDAPREDAKRVVNMLRSRGIEVVMCTGDSQITAQAISAEVGIHQVHAKCTPAEKKNLVDSLKQTDKHVVMVGDGINDAPALAAATVGIAMGSGVRIACESADVVLVRNDSLAHIVGLVDLGKATLRCVKRNLVWAFGFNVVMIPYAAGVFHSLGAAQMPPAYAGAAMATSSLLVVTSSLLLGRFRPPASNLE